MPKIFEVQEGGVEEGEHVGACASKKEQHGSRKTPAASIPFCVIPSSKPDDKRQFEARMGQKAE